MTIKSINKAVDILNFISNDVSRLSELSRKTRLSKSTVHRILQTLDKTGLVHEDPLSREYYPGPLLFKLASNPLKAHQYLIYLSHTKMDYLRNLTGETISLDIKIGMEKVKLQQLTGTHNILFVGVPPYYEYIWSGSMGKALLAQLPEQELEMIMENIELLPLTPRTITDKEVFKQEISKVRRQGYATGYGETDVSIAGISAPVSNYFVPAALSIIGPVDRLSSRMADFSRELKKQSEIISQDLEQNLKHQK
jgi:IclR family transcriptional regulator, KDG regulon repressor